MLSQLCLFQNRYVCSVQSQLGSSSSLCCYRKCQLKNVISYKEGKFLLMLKHYIVKTYGDLEVKLHHRQPRYWMEVSSQPPVPAALLDTHLK